MAKRKKSALEEKLKEQMKEAGLPTVRAEFPFHPTRKWRADFAFVPQKILIECEGGTWLRHGGHTSGAGYEKDCQKYNAAALLHYRVLRFTGRMIRTGEALRTIEAALTNQSC